MITTIARSILRHYPFFTPRASLLRMLPHTPANYGAFNITGGLEIQDYPQCSSDHVVKSLFWLGSFDPWVCSTLKLLALPGTTVLDIGANIGLMTLILSKAIGPTGRVYSFEPAPDSCRRLRSNVAANLLSNVEMHELALSDQTQLCQLVLPEKGQNGMARLGQPANGEASFTVPTNTFDEWASSRELGRISVCKIDVEGHESNVITGMKDSLDSGMIDAIVFEDHLPPDESPTQKILKSFGFQLFRMSKTLRRVHYHNVEHFSKGKPTSDYVALREACDVFNCFSRNLK